MTEKILKCAEEYKRLRNERLKAEEKARRPKWKDPADICVWNEWARTRQEALRYRPPKGSYLYPDLNYDPFLTYGSKHGKRFTGYSEGDDQSLASAAVEFARSSISCMPSVWFYRTVSHSPYAWDS